MHILLSRTIVNALLLLTQWVDLGCVGVHYSLYGERALIRIGDQPPLDKNGRTLLILHNRVSIIPNLLCNEFLIQ